LTKVFWPWSIGVSCLLLICDPVPFGGGWGETRHRSRGGGLAKLEEGLGKEVVKQGSDCSVRAGGGRGRRGGRTLRSGEG